MSKPIIKNWKLKEVENNFEIYHQNSFKGKSILIEKTKLPLTDMKIIFY